MHKPEIRPNQADSSAFNKLTGPTFDVCALGRRAYSGVIRECQLLVANFISKESLTLAVVDKILKHREQISTIPGGASWLGYIKLLGQQDLKALPERRRPVPVIAEVMEALTFMQGYIKIFATQLRDPNLANPRELKPIQRQIVSELESRISQAIAGPTIERAELKMLSRLFSIVATQQLYLHENRTRDLTVFGDSAESIIRRTSISEERIDQIYGRCALPLPFSNHLPFHCFRKIEGVGIVPLGLTVEVQHVDGVRLEPDRFEAHDDDHFFNRMRERNNALTVGITLSLHAPVDMALHQGIDSALAFSDVLDHLLKTLPSKRSQTLAEAVVFYIIRETRDVYGILDFNAEQMKRQAALLIRQSDRADTSAGTNQYWDLVRRLSNAQDLGQAFRTKPTAEEVFKVLVWLVKTL